MNVIDAKVKDRVQWEAWAGEVRVNLIRLVAIGLFYAQHLVHVVVFRDPRIDMAFHVRATLLTIAWSVLVAFLFVIAKQKVTIPSLKYAVTAFDTLLITALIALTDSHRGVWNVLFLLPIAASVLRLSLPLVYVSSILSMIAYACSTAYYIYWVVGAERYVAEPDLRIQSTEFTVMILSILVAGLFAGQAVRQAMRLAFSLTLSERENA